MAVWAPTPGRRKQAVADAPLLEPSSNPGDILKPGIYLLLHRGRVVHVGRAECMLNAIYHNRTVNNGPDRLPSWFPVKHVQFDDVRIHPIPYKATAALAQALTEFHRPHSQGFRTPEPLFDPVPPPTQPSITRRI